MPQKIIYILGFLVVFLLIGLSILGYFLYQNSNTQTAQIINLKKDVETQRKQKDEIRGLWEKQAARNDEMVVKQQQLIDSSDEYVLEIKRSIRFVNSIPDILPTISETRLKSAQLDIKNDQVALKNKTDQVLEEKQKSKDQIDTLYLQSQEDQNNRVNPRDGLR